jgi:FkbM family methyltransferase
MTMTALKNRLRSGVKHQLRRLLRQPGKLSAFDAIYAHFFDDRSVPDGQVVIFDVGAHVGESVRRFKILFPRSVIHSFEADEENYQNLCMKFSAHEGLFLNHFGVGSQPGKEIFHRNTKTDTSGFVPVNQDSAWAKLRSRQHNVETKDYTTKSYEVEIRTIDSYMKEQGIERVHLLKIDTQGYEDEVLKGAADALKNQQIDMIETELIPGNAYTKSLNFYDLDQILIPCGYKFYGIDRGGNLLASPSLALNLVYVSDRFLNS